MGIFSFIHQLLDPTRAYAEAVRILQFEVCDTDVGLPNCTTNLPGYVNSTILGGTDNIYTAFFGITFAMMVFYGIKLAITSRSDSATSETISAFSQALFGVMLVTGSLTLANSFATPGLVADVPAVESLLREVVEFITRLVGIALTLNIVIQGIRFIVAVNEGNTDSARRNLIQSFIGAAIVILATPIIDLILPGTFNTGISNQIGGIANFIATIFGLMAVIAIIIAGIMLLVSVDEGLRDRARRLIITALVAVGVVVSAAGIIQVLL